MSVSLYGNLFFVILELIMAVVTGSQAVLLDAVYDGIEFFMLLPSVLLIPLLYKPSNDKYQMCIRDSLRILSSPTCVGLRYGRPCHCQHLFSPAWIHMLMLLIFAPYQASAARCAYFTTHQPKPFDRLYHQPAHAILLCQCITHMGGTGISTCFPSPTTIVLGLGPDLPWADEPSPGILGLSTCKFLACISLLIPAFSLL